MKKLTASAILIVGFLVLALSTPKLSSAATLSLSPASGTYGKGSTIKVNVYVNTGSEKVNAVQANFSYPQDKLKFSSVSTSGSALTIVAEKGGGGGYVKIGGGAPTPGFSGNKFLAAVNFVVLTDSGSATLTFAGDSAILKDADNSNIYTGGSPATYTLAGTSSDSGQNLPGISPGSQSGGDFSGTGSFTLSNVEASEVTRNSAKITWSTSVEATSEMEYGYSQNYEFNALSEGIAKEHTITSSDGLLIPGNIYHFRVRSKDSKGAEVLGENMTFMTPGYSVMIIVKDEKGALLKGASVTLYSEVREAVTDDNGEVTFDNVSPGEHGLVVRHEGKARADKLQIAESEDLQVFEESFRGDGASQKAGSWLIYALGGFSVLIVLIMVLVLILRFRKKKSPEELPTVFNQPL